MQEGFVKIAELSPDSIELAWNAYDPQTGELCTWRSDQVHVHGSRSLESACACTTIGTIAINIFIQLRSIFRTHQAYGNGPNEF